MISWGLIILSLVMSTNMQHRLLVKPLMAIAEQTEEIVLPRITIENPVLDKQQNKLNHPDFEIDIYYNKKVENNANSSKVVLFLSAQAGKEGTLYSHKFRTLPGQIYRISLVPKKGEVKGSMFKVLVFTEARAFALKIGKERDSFVQGGEFTADKNDQWVYLLVRTENNSIKNLEGVIVTREKVTASGSDILDKFVHNEGIFD